MSATGNVAGELPWGRRSTPGADRFRALAIAFGVLVTLASCTGKVMAFAFDQPSLLKYTITVVAPLSFTLLVALRDPFRALVGALIVVTPFAFEANFQNMSITPVALLLGGAGALLALETTRLRLGGLAAKLTPLALTLLAPAIIQATSPLHYMLLFGSVFAVGLLASRVARRPGGRTFLFQAIGAMAFIQSLIAIWEFVTHKTLNLYGSAGGSQVANNYFFSYGTVARPAAALPDPISLGNVLAVSLPLVLILMLNATRVRSFLVYAICELTILLALVLTLSRDSWIAGALSIIVTIALLPRARLRAVAMLGGVVIVALTLALSLGGPTIRERFSSIANPTARGVSTAQGDQDRKNLWHGALVVAAQHRVFGVGFGGLKAQLARHIAPPAATVGGAPSLHAHSTYFQTLAESGTLGFIAIFGLIIASLVDLIRGWKVEPRAAAGIAAAIFGMLICMTTDYTVRYIQVAGVMAVIVACAASMRTEPTAQ